MESKTKRIGMTKEQEKCLHDLDIHIRYVKGRYESGLEAHVTGTKPGVLMALGEAMAFLSMEAGLNPDTFKEAMFTLIKDYEKNYKNK